MRMKHKLLFAGVATALAGITAVAAADRQPVHVMTVALPGGGVEQIRYTGAIAPHVVVQDEAAPDAASFFDAAFGPDSPFAAMDRISAEMDRQMAGMMQQAATMQRMTPAQIEQAMLADAPAGARSSFTMISTSSNGEGCSQTVRMSSAGADKAPQVIRTSAGDCDSAVAKPQGPSPVSASAPPAAAPAMTPATLPARPVAPKPSPDSI